MRAQAREIVGSDDFLDVFVKCSFETCEQRDVKGLYAKAKSGQIKNFTGRDSSFEEPDRADLVIDTDAENLDASLDRLYDAVQPLIQPSAD